MTRTVVWRGHRVLVFRNPEHKGKCAGFWHCTSVADPDSADRIPDLRRCERIRWIRALLVAPSAEVRTWEESPRGRDRRFVIATPEFDFLVVLRLMKAGLVQLVTAYHVEWEGRRAKYRREYEQAVKDGRTGP
jgi:hypothetical protein